MKTLLLLRHAKSSWDEPGRKDFDRPLNSRGRAAAPLMGRLLRRQNILPELVISSPALRARQTASLFMEAAGLNAKLRYDERIYEASAARLLELISHIEEDAGIALLIGHNPGLSELLLHLTGTERQMQTAALACLTLETESWAQALEKTGRLEWLYKPKDLEQETKL